MDVANGQSSPPEPTVQVFLAYAADPAMSATAADMAAVESLRQCLERAQIAWWECPSPWPSGTAPEVLIARAIEACHNYVLAVSPRALADTHCLQGLLFALSLHKRIVPVLVEAVPPQHLPEPLQRLPLIDGIALEPTPTDPPPLVSTLRHAADYHQTHTELLVRALRWERASRQPSLLLQGDDLQHYQRWIGGAQGRSQHPPIQLQTFYVAESIRHHRDRTPSKLRPLTWLERWFT